MMNLQKFLSIRGNDVEKYLPEETIKALGIPWDRRYSSRAIGTLANCVCSSFPCTIRHLRSVPDKELILIKNMGTITICFIRDRIGHA